MTDFHTVSAISMPASKTCFSGTIYFLGQYRPAYFEGTSLEDVESSMLAAVRYLPDRQWFVVRIKQAASYLQRMPLSQWSTEHGARGVSMDKRPHDPFLDDVTRDMAPLPALDYSMCVNR